jgi:hypothetical protein
MRGRTVICCRQLSSEVTPSSRRQGTPRCHICLVNCPVAGVHVQRARGSADVCQGGAAVPRPGSGGSRRAAGCAPGAPLWSRRRQRPRAAQAAHPVATCTRPQGGQPCGVQGATHGTAQTALLLLPAGIAAQNFQMTATHRKHIGSSTWAGEQACQRRLHFVKCSWKVAAQLPSQHPGTIHAQQWICSPAHA